MEGCKNHWLKKLFITIKIKILHYKNKIPLEKKMKFKIFYLKKIKNNNCMYKNRSNIVV